MILRESESPVYPAKKTHQYQYVAQQVKEANILPPVIPAPADSSVPCAGVDSVLRADAVELADVLIKADAMARVFVQNQTDREGGSMVQLTRIAPTTWPEPLQQEEKRVKKERKSTRQDRTKHGQMRRVENSSKA